MTTGGILLLVYALPVLMGWGLAEFIIRNSDLKSSKRASSRFLRALLRAFPFTPAIVSYGYGGFWVPFPVVIAAALVSSEPQGTWLLLGVGTMCAIALVLFFVSGRVARESTDKQQIADAKTEEKDAAQ
jgi:hypothetical protein